MPITQINDGNGLNTASGRSINDHSTFINKFPIPGTYRFGEYGINFCAEVNPDENHTLHLGHNVISNTLKAPLLQDVILKKDLFWVPDQCILPRNWEKFFVNPVKGQDVPNDVGCSVEHFGQDILNFFSEFQQAIVDILEDEEPNYLLALEMNLKLLLCHEMIFAYGSLNSALQGNLTGIYGRDFDYGAWFDDSLQTMLDAHTDIEISINGIGYHIGVDYSASHNRTVLALMRDDFSWSVASVDIDEDQVVPLVLPSIQYGSSVDFPFNLRRLWAYQIVCAHFFTNDKIDYVYSAELFRQLVGNAYYDFQVALGYTASCPKFTVNGLTYDYDFLSAKIFNDIVSNADFTSITATNCLLNYFRLLFGYNLSLRYLDYFTGSRSQPLAVGDVNVAVNNNMVNVVNIAAKTMAAKMLNVANRIGQRIESYVKEFFHIEMAKDYHNPFWLAHTADQIDNPENQNTGSDQYTKVNSITSIFRTGGNSQGFECEIDRSGIIIGISYFDIERVYPRSINRCFFHVDRYDDFLPYLQYVGDQKVFQMEADSSLDYSLTFGYQGRNMEYKQQVPYCFGGFAKDLAPYVFLADEQRIIEDNILRIGPSFIRSLPTELDRFFNILNGYSIDTYYHFAIVNNIYWEAKRPMAATPGILNG